MAVTPNSLITPQTPQAKVTALSTTANTGTNAATNAVLVATAGPNGARVTKARVMPNLASAASVVATQVQLFRDGGSAGVTKLATNTVLMPAYTQGNTLCQPTDFGYSDTSPLILAANEQLYLAQSVGSQAVTAEIEWANY